MNFEVEVWSCLEPRMGLEPKVLFMSFCRANRSDVFGANKSEGVDQKIWRMSDIVLPFGATLDPLLVHPPSQPPRPPTLRECQTIARHLQQINNRQAHEVHYNWIASLLTGRDVKITAITIKFLQPGLVCKTTTNPCCKNHMLHICPNTNYFYHCCSVLALIWQIRTECHLILLNLT